MDRKKIIASLQTPKAVKWFWIVVTAPFALLLLLLLLTAAGLFGKLPSFEELENPKSNISTEIYSEDGQMIGSFYVQNRSYVDYDEISPNLVAALISTEDSRFYSHSGIDFISLARVGVKTLALGNRSQGGGSTITQQLAKNLFPRDTSIYSNPFSRNGKLVLAKLKEWITAVKLEYNYTKEEIIAMYLNIVPYGSNAFGIKSAAQTFFNKLPSEVSVEEAALLVGVVNAPTKYSPVRNPERALARRNTVIDRMEANGYLTRTQRDSLKQVPITLDYHPISHNMGSGTYFREMLRTVMTARRPEPSDYYNEWDYRQAAREWEENPLYGWCNKNMKADGTPYNIYRDGLKIYTTINSSMQRYAEKAVAEQMSKEVQPAMERQYKRTGKLFIGVDREGAEKIVRSAMRYTDRYRTLKARGASQAEIDKAFDTPVEMRVFSYRGDIDTVMTPRDSILYHKRMMRCSFMALDPSTGHLKAYVGGPDFRYFKYDMVRQGKRQVGSTIKPFIYTFAIEHLGFNPCTLVPNLPTTIETDTGDAWTPKEAGNVVYDGALKPLKWGLANSRNNYSAWIMKQAKQPVAVADFIHKMGIRSYIDPVYALCLGTPDVSLYEMVSAYATFANRGVYTDPIFVTRIEDRHGNLIASFTPTSNDAVSEQTAYTMLGMLKNVVNAGTAGRLRWMFKFTGDMGGKTGTSQNNSDAWFIGVTPKLVAGAWVGGEDRSVHLYSRAEGSIMALPIYGKFMQQVYADPKLGIKQTDTFPLPVGAVTYECDSEAAAEPVPQEGGDEFFD
ncbi:penicillin-binding protein 1A [Gallalistipes aquisgranensis]|uniref:penicillin-binding protein 1A n=1 Tax=Gallalistipes aquisgranensis TaxID=2779358 RepID=UPI001CF8F5C6|nr:transglycosylase domain-containing protein [Gallalistipes aquisgranensis]MBE5034456.1 penicillin-binding protein [Gallalistipes aquisgranensis]